LPARAEHSRNVPKLRRAGEPGAFAYKTGRNVLHGVLPMLRAGGKCTGRPE
jgi:hypothetical protein